jgi:short-subunit dehydrogenase
MPDRPTALITGASAGIGRDLAGVLAENRFDLIIVARNQQALEKLAAELSSQYKIHVEVIVRDLSYASAPDEIHAKVREKGITLDVLINNAGFGTHGPFAGIDVKLVRDMLHVNVVALTLLTRLFLPDMLARKRGRIMNVASTAAFQPGPLMAEYYASKAYVLWLSEAIATEVAGSGVTVTALCPGPTTTEFQKRAGIENTRMFERVSMDSMSVARIGYEGMMGGKRIVIPGFKNRILAQAVRLGPRKMIADVVKKMNQTRSDQSRAKP